MASGNSWLARQRKSDLIDMAGVLGLKEYVTDIHPLHAAYVVF